MKQWFIEGSQGDESLQLKDVPYPEPGDYEILVKFYAASLNFRDIMIANVWPCKNHSESAPQAVQLSNYRE